MFSFIQELSEARLFRTPAMLDPEIKLSELAESFFTAILTLELLQILSSESAKNYAEKTLEIDNINVWRSSGSDLHNLAHILSDPAKYKNKIKADRFISLPKLQFYAYLRNLADNKKNDIFLLKSQQHLNISSPALKKIRRKLSAWDRCTDAEKASAITNLYLMLRKNLNHSDLYKVASPVLKRSKMISKEADLVKAKSPAWYRLMQEN